jgi:hypothetical protein
VAPPSQFASPPDASSFSDVHTTGDVGDPFASSRPFTLKPTPAATLNVTPAGTVSVCPFGTVAVAVRTYVPPAPSATPKPS